MVFEKPVPGRFFALRDPAHGARCFSSSPSISRFSKLWKTASFEPSLSMKTSRWRLCSVKRVTLCACLVLVRWAALRYEYAVPDDATSASVRAVVQPEHSKTSPSVFQSRMLTLHGEHPPLQISHRRSIPVHLMLCASWAFSAHQLGCDLSFSWPSPI